MFLTYPLAPVKFHEIYLAKVLQWERSNFLKVALKFCFLKDHEVVGLPKDSTQKFKCFLSIEKVLLFKVMYRVGFQGARTCQFFDVQISIKLRVNYKVEKKFISRSIFDNSFAKCAMLPPGGGTPLYNVYRYVPPQRVWFLSRFGLKTGIDLDNYGLKSGRVFGAGNIYESLQTYFSSQNELF